jgi:hypothetical protein
MNYSDSVSRRINFVGWAMRRDAKDGGGFILWAALVQPTPE